MVADRPGWVLLDERGLPLAGLAAAVEDGDGWTPVAFSDAEGRLVLPSGNFSGPLALCDPLGVRELATLPEGGGEVRVPRARATGWLVTSRGDVPSDVWVGNDVEPLVDEAMFDAIVENVRRARDRLDISQLLFPTEFVCAFRGGLVGPPRPVAKLADELVAAAERGVNVRVLLNQNAVIPDSVDEMEEAAGAVDGLFDVRRFPMTPNVMHAKMLVRDADEALLVGPPFQQRFWDTTRHDAVDARRKGEKPHHDLALRIRGPAVGGVSRFFTLLWNERAPDAPLDPVAPPAPCGTQTLQLVRTLPEGIAAGPAQHGILEAYLRALAHAERYVYLETQYFTNRTIVRALKRALERRPRLEVILVVNEHMDVPGYDLWQARRLQELGYPDHPRLGAFVLWRPMPTPRPRLRATYIHSKTALVDDVWATLGSANLDSISLQVADEFGVPIESNVEANAIVLDGIAGAPATGFVARLRRRLWAEHLGDEGVWRADAPAEGWLPLWQGLAERNLHRFNRGDHHLTGAVMPYRPPTPRLAELLNRT